MGGSTNGAGLRARSTSAPDMNVPLLHKVEDAGRRLGFGHTKIWQLVSSGELESVKVGRSRRIPEISLVEYIERLRAQAAA